MGVPPCGPCLADHVEDWSVINMDYEQEGRHLHLVVSHSIWCPTRRRQALVGPIGNRLEQIVREVAAENRWRGLALAIRPDQGHLCVRADPNTLPADLSRRIQGRSAHHLRQELPHLRKLPSMWTRSCFLVKQRGRRQTTTRDCASACRAQALARRHDG